jgi:hypothetical protein
LVFAEDADVFDFVELDDFALLALFVAEPSTALVALTLEATADDGTVAIIEVALPLPDGGTAGFTVSVGAGAGVGVGVDVASTGAGVAPSFANSRYATSTYASFAFFAISVSSASSVR